MTDYNPTPVLVYRLAPEGFYAAPAPDGRVRILVSDPFETEPPAEAVR